MRQLGGAKSTSATNKAPRSPTQANIHTKYRRGVPATNSMANPAGKSTSAEPRSGSFRIKTNGSIIRPSAFQKVSGTRNSSTGRLRKWAWARMTASLANSDGCRLKKPRSNHRRAPNRTVPKNKTTASRNTANQ